MDYCDFCKKEIFIKAFHKKYKTHFCNDHCFRQYTQTMTLLKTNCCNCKKEIYKTKVQQRHSKTGLFFCGNLCKNRFLANNKKWRTDNIHSYDAIRDVVLEKSKYTCQKCGYNENSKMLDIHHYDHNHKNNDVSNFRVLCVFCHVKHHRLKEEYELPIILKQEDLKVIIQNFHDIRKNKYCGKTKYIKECESCHTSFETIDKIQRFCSYECSNMGRRKVVRPSKEELIILIEKFPITTIARQYSVSDKAIGKWAKSYEIDVKDIKKKKKELTSVNKIV